MGTLLHSCANVHKPIELSFGVVSRVGRRTGILDGGPGASRATGGFGGFSSPLV